MRKGGTAEVRKTRIDMLESSNDTKTGVMARAWHFRPTFPHDLLVILCGCTFCA
jgi:hypothetical protein